MVVFASGQQAQQARRAGADVVGAEELVDQILSGSLNPDKLITTPDLASLFTRNPQLARLLGPKGLMPSAKRGTVASDIAQAVKEARGGLDWKGDSQGVVRAGEEPETSVAYWRHSWDRVESSLLTVASLVLAFVSPMMCLYSNRTCT